MFPSTDIFFKNLYTMQLFFQTLWILLYKTPCGYMDNNSDFFHMLNDLKPSMHIAYEE